jgi:hypothetical protein
MAVVVILVLSIHNFAVPSQEPDRRNGLMDVPVEDDVGVKYTKEKDVTALVWPTN